jgi:hypothetical protein
MIKGKNVDLKKEQTNLVEGKKVKKLWTKPTRQLKINGITDCNWVVKIFPICKWIENEMSLVLSGLQLRFPNYK